MDKNTVYKGEVVKRNSDKAIIRTVEPVVQHTAEPDVEHIVKPVIKLVKHDKVVIDTVKSVEKDNTDKNNKISCDQIKNMNESHKIKLKNCTNENFNIFD
jgi:hypothetical protein